MILIRSHLLAFFSWQACLAWQDVHRNVPLQSVSTLQIVTALASLPVKTVVKLSVSTLSLPVEIVLAPQKCAWSSACCVQVSDPSSGLERGWAAIETRYRCVDAFFAK